MIEVRMQFETIEEMIQKLGNQVKEKESTVDETGSVTTEPPQAEPDTPVDTNEVDSTRRPWDARINTVKRTKTKDGVWKLTRGVDKDLVQQVYAELDAAKAVDEPPVPAEQTAAPEPEIIEQLGPPSVETVAEPVTAEQVQQKITELMQHAKLTATEMIAMLAEHNVPNMGMLAQFPDEIPKIMMKLEGIA